MAHYSNPTENAAVGSLSKEWNRLSKRATRLASLYYRGKLSEEELARSWREFPGIYRWVLIQALDAAEKKASTPT